MMSADLESKTLRRKGGFLGPLHPNGAHAPSIPPAHLLRGGHSHLSSGSGERHEADSDIVDAQLKAKTCGKQWRRIGERDDMAVPRSSPV
jgi:hypothetical protein